MHTIIGYWQVVFKAGDTGGYYFVLLEYTHAPQLVGALRPYHMVDEDLSLILCVSP